jgi:hypothetical protein
MTQTYATIYDSISEGTLAPAIRTLGGERCNSFEPLLPKRYLDGDGAEQTGKPDFLIEHGSDNYHFIETKNGVLNNHYSQEESTEALHRAYGEVFGRYGGNLAHHQLSSELYAHSTAGRIAVRAHGWNHSLYKLLALQAQHGWQRFIVVFQSNPTKVDAQRYCQAGLVFCTIKTLPALLETIKYMRYGIYIPFRLTTRNYSFTIMPDLSTGKLSDTEVEFHDRAKFLAAIDADKAGRAEALAQAAADWDAGLRPF